jgi:hypothetical protein
MSTNGWWAVTLGLGLVVAVVVLVLLQLFLNQLRRIERGADQIWLTGKAVARNTATSWQLGTTSARLEALEAEAQRHAALVGVEGTDGKGR